MTPSSLPPPPSGNGNLKYVIAGILLLAGTGGMWAFLQSDPPVPPPKAAPTAERSTSLATQELLVEPEAEPPEVAEPEPATPEPQPKRKAGGTAQGPWDCSGDLDASALKEVIAQNRAQVRTCYEKRLKVNNVLQGNLNLRLRIAGNGKVSATYVGGTLQDKEVFSCVRSLAERWSFPTPNGGVCAVVEIPFSFTPKT